MTTNRREFLRGAAAFGAAAWLAVDGGASRAYADAPNPEDPNDPNAIVDPDHEIGKPYAGWKEGDLDLHFIHTGLTENCFHVFPDGTTALVDTGDRSSKNFGKVAWNRTKSDAAACAVKPDDSRRPGEWVARYISRICPDLETIDYVIASHFHADHTGCEGHGAGKKGLEKDADYMISGISHVGEFYKFGTAFDRGYPDYEKPVKISGGDIRNLTRFWSYAEKTYGLKREEFRVGALDQIKLTKAPEKYDFHVRNICRNGVVWTGKGEKTIDFYAENPANFEKTKSENTLSTGHVIQYGAFRYFTGGDVSGKILDAQGADADFEGRVGRATGPVDACKTNHHASLDAMRRTFIEAVQSRVYVTCCWWMGHVPERSCANMADESLYPGPRLMCPTDPHPMNAPTFQGKPWRRYLCERGGHVVIKAYDGGARYKVYFLTADDESMRVNLVFGPFESTGTARLAARDRA